jgi:hypothetical protein
MRAGSLETCTAAGLAKRILRQLKRERAVTARREQDFLKTAKEL